MVQCGMLPRPRRHLDDIEGRRSAQGAPQGSRASDSGRPQHKFRGNGGRPKRGGHRGHFRDRGTGGHGTSLPPVTALLVLVQADVGHATEGKGSAVPDKLYPGDGPPSLWECLRSGPLAQLGPLHGPGLPVKRLPDGTQEIPRGAEEVATEVADETNTVGRSICGPTEGRPESEGARGETERVDIGGDVETCRRESLRA